MIGNHGKRYLSAFRQLNLIPQNTLKFYTAFFTSINHRTEDRPNDQDKIEAIEEIKKLIRGAEKPHHYFNIYDLNEIKRLDPDFYKFLTDQR